MDGLKKEVNSKTDSGILDFQWRNKIRPSFHIGKARCSKQIETWHADKFINHILEVWTVKKEPGMFSIGWIEEFVSQCPVCNIQENSNPRIPHPIPGRPRSAIGTDCSISMFQITQCLLIITPNSQKSAVWHNCSECNCGHACPWGMQYQIVSDNGPQYTSTEFRDFTWGWGFEHVTHSRSWTSSIINLLKKARSGKSDPYIAILKHTLDGVKVRTHFCQYISMAIFMT